MWLNTLRVNKQLLDGLYIGGARHVANKATRLVDTSKVPELIEADLEESFISGSGPGGQSVNKAVNCCQLKHKPTGIVVKVHQLRSLTDNRKIARELMIKRLDNLYNGEDSVENQKKRIALCKLEKREEQQRQKRLMKEQYKKNLRDGGSA